MTTPTPTPREIVKRRADQVKAGTATPVQTPAPVAAVEPWADPIPLSAAVAPPPEFPLDVFPEWVSEFVRQVAKGVNAPIDYPAVFALGVAAGAIGATRRIEITPSWYERACLYLCVVAPKSSGKTPTFLAVTNPLRKIQAKLLKEHESDKDKPIVYTTDTTSEAIAPLLRSRPRGLIVASDELAGWIGGFNQYKGGKGNDRQMWLSIWSGGDISVLRRNPDAPHIYVPHPCVSVVGGVQPSVLAELAASRDDGLLERLLLCKPVPKHAPELSRDGYPLAKEWEQRIEALVREPMLEGDYGPRSTRITISKDAEEVFDAWYRVPAADERLAGAMSKLKGYAARLALVLHTMVHCPGAGNVEEREVNAETMEGGVRLAKYFLGHAEHIYGSHRQSPAVADAEKVLAWVKRSLAKLRDRAKACGLGPADVAFERRDVQRDLIRQFPNADDLRAPLKLLVDLGYIRWLGGNHADRWVFRVNPKVVGDVGGLSAGAPTEKNE